jgi:hypothetical protein
MTEPTNTTKPTAPTAPTTEPTEEPRDPNDPFVQDDITLEKHSAAIRLGAAHGALLL